jgi:non-specific serine/threonine protein kinase
VLLVLDNCEHVLAACAKLVSALVSGCPDLRVLATSRERLGVPGEQIWTIASLAAPGADQASDPEAMLAYDAVRLFVDRARAVAPTFAVSTANADAVAKICRRLDGIPLAVELAAARVRALPPAQIAARLDDRFRLLTGGSRTALPRHRTLRAAMDWSFDLLDAPQQAILPRLSVFAGSFSLDAAEAVVSDADVPAEDVLDLLGNLVDRSLLLAEDNQGEARYRMLETIRDYAQERLAESGEAAARHARHRDWFVDLVDRGRSAFFSGAVQPEWITRLVADQDNLRAALSWAHEDLDGPTAELALVSGLWRFWEVRGDFEEGSVWLERALERVGGDVSHRRASALTGAGVFAAHRGDLAKAAAFHEASLMLTRELGDPLTIASALSNLANISIERNDLDRARELYVESIELSRPRDPHFTAFTVVNLADLTARRGDEAEADRLFAECIDLFEQVGDEWGIAHAATRLANAARRRGDLETARRRFADALEMHRRTGDRHAEARVLSNTADVAGDLGDLADAEALYQQSLAIRSELGDRLGIAAVLERLAGVAEDRPERAAALLGAAAAMRDAIGAPLSAAGLARLDQFIATLHRTSGTEAVDRALADGRAAPLPRTLARAAGRD